MLIKVSSDSQISARQEILLRIVFEHLFRMVQGKNHAFKICLFSTTPLPGVRIDVIELSRVTCEERDPFLLTSRSPRFLTL